MASERPEKKISKLETGFLALGLVVGGIVGGLYLGHLSAEYDSIGHLAASLSRKSYEVHKQDVIENRVNDFFLKYDSDGNGLVDQEEYRNAIR